MYVYIHNVAHNVCMYMYMCIYIYIYIYIYIHIHTIRKHARKLSSLSTLR